jgi:hypothetical protein
MKSEHGISQRRERLWKIPLIIYFIAIMASTIVAIISIWNPVGSPITSTSTSNSNETQLIVSIPDNDINKWVDDREKYLIIVNALFGILGGSTYGLASITIWIANNKFENSWTLWYISRPIIGGGLALIFYFLLRAGLVSGFPVNVGDFGFAAISIIIGLLATVAMKKIRDVFDVLFGITKTKEDIGDEPTPTANANLKLTAQATRIEVGKDLEIRATASSGDGTYAQGSIKFSIENSTVARFINNNLNEDTANIITVDFQNGLATAKIKGINKGKTEIIAVSKIDDKDLSDKITIEVIESPPIPSTTTAIL